MANILNKIKSRIRSWSHARFQEPIVVIESDDWGMWRSPDAKNQLESFGVPKIWGYDQLEKIDELELLYSTLEKHSDCLDNKPFIETNFVVCNPDFEKTKSTHYGEIILKPLYSDAVLCRQYKNGIERKVIQPQYHGRLHFNYDMMLKMLQSDPLSKNIFENEIHGGINNYEFGQWKLHSEYQQWENGKIPSDLNDWITVGIAEFESAFGYKPTSTIAPQYIITPSTIDLFHKKGFTCIQGTNMLLYKGQTGNINHLNYPLGAKLTNGLIALSRNVKFEPARNNKAWNMEAALAASKSKILQNIPVVIDSHRINFTGKFAESGISQLNVLLKNLCRLGVRFMSSIELSEAINNNGTYHEFFTKQKREITPVNNSMLNVRIRNSVS